MDLLKILVAKQSTALKLGLKSVFWFANNFQLSVNTIDFAPMCVDVFLFALFFACIIWTRLSVKTNTSSFIENHRFIFKTCDDDDDFCLHIIKQSLQFIVMVSMKFHGTQIDLFEWKHKIVFLYNCKIYPTGRKKFLKNCLSKFRFKMKNDQFKLDLFKMTDCDTRSKHI